MLHRTVIPYQYKGSVIPQVEIYDSDFMVLVGPQGCGKSTTLRMLAGLEEVNSGHNPWLRTKRHGKETVGVRPEAWRIVAAEEGGLPVSVTVVEELGADSFVYGTSNVEGLPHDVTVRVAGRGTVHKGESLFRHHPIPPTCTFSSPSPTHGCRPERRAQPRTKA